MVATMARARWTGSRAQREYRHSKHKASKDQTTTVDITLQKDLVLQLYERVNSQNSCEL